MACDEFMPRDENILSTEFFNSGAILALTVSVLVANMVLSKKFYAQIVAYSGHICQCGEIAAIAVTAIIGCSSLSGGSRMQSIATVIQTAYDLGWREIAKGGHIVLRSGVTAFFVYATSPLRA